MRRNQLRSVGSYAVTTLAVIILSGCGAPSSSGIITPPSQAAASESPELDTLIEAENASVYAYGVIGAHLSGAARTRALAALDAHRRLRDSWIQAAQASGRTVPPAAIAYDLPFRVHDATTAKELAAVIETRLLLVYRSAGPVAAGALAKAEARAGVRRPLND